MSSHLPGEGFSLGRGGSGVSVDNDNPIPWSISTIGLFLYFL